MRYRDEPSQSGSVSLHLTQAFFELHQHLVVLGAHASYLFVETDSCMFHFVNFLVTLSACFPLSFRCSVLVEKEMAEPLQHSCPENPRTEEPGGLQSRGQKGAV